jgi:hypothetical protein
MPELAWSAIPGALVVCFLMGFFPVAAMRLIVHLYPKGHIRRQELMAEIHAVEWKWRVVWVFEQLALALFEGLSERQRDRKEARDKERQLLMMTWLLIRRYGVPSGDVWLAADIRESGLSSKAQKRLHNYATLLGRDEGETNRARNPTRN